MLLQAKKELGICGDLCPEDVYFYYSTTFVHFPDGGAKGWLIHSFSGWMMWNFLVSGLSLGCTLVLYDGSPLKDPSYLWKLVDDLGISIFGTSAKYIDTLSVKFISPRISILPTRLNSLLEMLPSPRTSPPDQS
jgi:acetoacetyl-CoA synthetase